MSKPQKTTFDFIMYRLDALEKRLDSVEKHMHSRSENPDIIKVLLELIKNGPQQQLHHQHNAIIDAVVATCDTKENPTSQGSQGSQDTNFDNLTMVRRRTVV